MQQPDKTLPVYIVDDDQAACESLAMMLEDYDFNVSAFTEGQAFLNAVKPENAGCVILDSRMPELNGQQLQQKLRQLNSPLSVIFLTGFGDVPMAVEALQSGAINFFQKPIKADLLVNALEKGLIQSVEQAEKKMLLDAYNALTPREIEILRLLIAGHRNAPIADELCISVRTVEVHRASLMKKFAASTVAELAFSFGKIDQKL